MDLPTYFCDFLKEIRLTDAMRGDAVTGHSTLRERLEADDDLRPVLVSTFLQGSYRRATAVRPAGGSRADVDVVVVTTLGPNNCEPADVIKRFQPFLDHYYEGKWVPSARAAQIQLSYVDLDLVVTGVCDDADAKMCRWSAVTDTGSLEDDGMSDWLLSERWERPRPGEPFNLSKMVRLAGASPKTPEPLWIPDREADEWERTNPLAQIQWTADKNRSTSGHFVNVVKALKWWRLQQSEGPKHPKGYPLEHMVGECCPDGVTSVAEAVTLVLEEMVNRWSAFAQRSEVPELQDRGVPHDVLARLSVEEFVSFIDQARRAAGVAREALGADGVRESALLWRELFGPKFPPPPDKSGGFTPRSGPSDPARGERFA